MRIKFMLQAAALSSTVFLCAFPALAKAQDANSQQTGDPIADAARRSREAKQNAAKPHKVYTDDDVSKPKPAPATDASGTASSSAASATGTAANATKTPADQDAKAEAAWRKRFQEQRDKIALAEKELDILQREAQKAQVQYYPDPQKAMTEQYTRKDINDKDAKIVAKQQEIAQLKQGLSDLEDELRKSGGDPGWAR
jgi:chromosome segregation ATPase